MANKEKIIFNVSVSFVGVLTFIAVWVTGCVIADYVLKLTGTAWVMMWGAITAFIADATKNAVGRKFHR